MSLLAGVLMGRLWESLYFTEVFQYMKRISCIAGSYAEEYFI